VLRELRAKPETKNTVIIITSAKAYKPDIDRARELGATGYVVKPFHTEELLELIEKHLATPPEQDP
jgi:DNA-binding response OmpR family regulator